MNSVWIVMDTGHDVGSDSVKGVCETKEQAKIFIADYVLENDVDTTHLEIFEREVEVDG